MSAKQGQAEAIQALADVVRLLCRCADLAFEQAAGRPRSDLPALGLGAQLVADQVMALLPLGVEVDEPAPACAEPRQCLLAAEALTRAVPIEAFPAGTSPVIAGLCDLIREHPA